MPEEPMKMEEEVEDTEEKNKFYDGFHRFENPASIRIPYTLRWLDFPVH